MSKVTAEDLAKSVGAGLKAVQAAERHGRGLAEVSKPDHDTDPRMALNRALGKHYEAHPPGTDPDDAA